MLRKVHTVQSETDSLALCLRSVLDSGIPPEAVAKLERIMELWPDLPSETWQAMQLMAEASHLAKGDS